MVREVLEADYHRNGVGGTGFYVGIIKDDDGSRKLVIDFGVEGETCVAVLDVDQVAAGNIYMHPQNGHPGGNAWRGDHYTELRAAFEETVKKNFDVSMAEFASRPRRSARID